MAFKITLLSDVRSFLKGTDDIEKSLDGVADSLDQLATESEASATQAADALERKFTDAFDKVKTEAKTTGRKLDDEISAGAKKAGQGLDEFKNEGVQSIRETAASFSDITDAADLVQEVAANAFSGFGPAGMAAGAAAAVGIGFVQTALEGASEATEATRQKAVELGKAFADAKDQTQALKDTIDDAFSENAEGKPWAWMGNIDRVTLWQKAVEQLGVTQSDVLAAASGDLEALGRISDQANAKLIDGNAGLVTQFVNDLKAQGEGVRDAQEWSETYTRWKQADTEATRDQTIEADKAAQRAAVLAGNTQLLADAQERATQATQTFSDGLTNNLSVADEGLDKFVKKGKLKVQEWADELNDRAKTNTRIKDFAVDVDTKLTPEALQNFESLPTETQDLIAKAYKSGGKGDRKKILANLEAEAKIDKVTVDTSGVKVTPVEVPVTVLTAGAITGTADAATAAQREANRQDNRIDFKTHIDVAELQRQVNRAAASITPPTIYANVKPRKEVP